MCGLIESKHAQFDVLITISLLSPDIHQSSLTAQLEYKLPTLLATGRVGVIVIDSIAALFRAEFGVEQAVQRAQILQECGAQLQRLSHSYGVAVICVNQVHVYTCTCTMYMYNLYVD